MPASCIFAAAPRQAGVSRGSGHRSRVGADQGCFVGRRKTRRQDKSDGRTKAAAGRDSHAKACGDAKVRHRKAAVKAGAAEEMGRPKKWGGRRDGGGSGEGRGKKIRLAHSGDGFFNRDSLPNGSRHSRTPDPASSPLLRSILGSSPQSERSHRSAMPGPGIRELTALEEVS